MCLGQEGEQSTPRGLVNSVQSAIEPSFREHSLRRNEFELLKEAAAALLIAVEEGCGNECDRHHFRGVQFGLRVFTNAPGLQKVGAKTVECDNLFLHERLR